MSRKKQILLACLVVLTSLLGQKPQPAQTANLETFTLVSLAPTWTDGVLSDGVGPAKIVVADLNQDGKTDIVTCSRGHVYVLNYTVTNTYETVWFSEYVNCYRLSSADRDSNGMYELYIANDDGEVVIFDSGDYHLLGKFTLPSGLTASDIEVADVDDDGTLEIVLSRSDATFVYDATTYNLEWQATGFGGNQVAIGNIDNDASPEIIVNGNPAHILNASQQIQEWAYSGGFGMHMGVGDIDGDSRAEIAYIDDWYNAYAFDGDTLTLKWQRTDLDDLNTIVVADSNGDGTSEVIIGDGQWGNVSGFRGSDGTNLWGIGNPEHGVFGIGVGDANNDSVNEILWGAGLSSSGNDELFVGSWVSQTVLWGSGDLDGPLYVAAGDVDNDGQGEIVMATRSTSSGYDGGTIRVYDGASHQLEWSTIIYNSYYDVSDMAIGQLDSDAALEILVGGDNWYDTRLKVYDGANHTVEWLSAVLGDGVPKELVVMDLDNDSIDEIIVALSDKHVLILHGASNIIQWDSGSLDNVIQDLSVGDLDGDGTVDLAVLTSQSVYIYEVGTWTQILHQTLANGSKLAITNAGIHGAGELLIITSGGGSNKILQAWDGTTLIASWQRSLGNVVVNDLAVSDLDSDSSQEFILLGYIGSVNDYTSLLWIGLHNYPFFWEYQMNAHWGPLNSSAIYDLDNDGQAELLLGSDALIQVNEMITSSVTIHQAFLPIISYPKQSRGLYGVVTSNGMPVAGVSLDLRFYDGDSWSTLTSTNTAADGMYSFTNMPKLNSGQFYYVRYQNTSGGNASRLWTWHTQSVGTYNPWSEFNIGNFDIASPLLVSPYDGATVQLPQTFQWTIRSATPSDIYEFDLYDPYDEDPYFYTDPPLGYVGEYTLNGLPAGFNVGDPYVWDIWIYSPDGGFGICYDLHVVYFSNTGSNATTSGQPTHTKTVLDFDFRSK